MNDLMKLILSLSLSGTVLIVLLLLSRPLYKNRLSKRWQYYIWLIVILRLLLPVTPGNSLTGTFFHKAEQTLSGFAASSLLSPGDGQYPSTESDPESESDSIPTDAGSVTPNTADLTGITGNADAAESADAAALADATESIDATDTADPVNAANTAAAVHPAGQAAPAGQIPAGTILFILWLFAALLLLVRKVTLYQSFRRYVDAGCNPIQDMRLLECFGRIMEQSRIRGAVDLYTNGLVSSPLLMGLLRPRIILPRTDLPEDDFYYTMLHELTHYRRLDILYKWLVQLVLCLHWFNPLVYLMKSEINRLCELSCDERVIMTLSENARKAYGDTLLHAVGTGGSYKNPLASVTLNESKELLKGRLDAIMTYKKISKFVRFAAVLTTGILIGGAVVLGAYAAPDDKFSPNAAAADVDRQDDGSSTDVQSVSDAPDSSSSAGDHKAADNNGSSALIPAASTWPDYRIRYEDNIYYIFIGDATEADKPISSGTNGYHSLVFVRKDGYATFGSFRDKDMANLVRHVESQCRTMLANGQITQEEKDFYLLAAKEIQDSWQSPEEQSDTAYLCNIQGGYYQKPYFVKLGYTRNQSALSQAGYHSRKVTLPDQTAIPLYYDAEYEQPLSSDEKALDIVTAAIERMLMQGNADDVKVVILMDLEYVGYESSSSLAQKFYEEENLLYFSAVFRELDQQAKLRYLDSMFADNKIACFSCCIDKLGNSGAQKEAVERYILKAYEEDRISFFFLLSDMLDEENRKQWLERCRKDGNTLYLSAFDERDVFDDWDDFDEWDSFDDWDDFEKWDAHLTGKDLLEEYSQNNTAAVMDLTRVTRAEVSDKVRTALDACEDGKWYVIEADDMQYIYYNGLPRSYAYEPQIDGSERGDLLTVDIVDIGTDSPLLRSLESAGSYVLLAFSYHPTAPDTSYELAIRYNRIPVTYTRSQAK